MAIIVISFENHSTVNDGKHKRVARIYAYVYFMYDNNVARIFELNSMLCLISAVLQPMLLCSSLISQVILYGYTIPHAQFSLT
jgi:hypothetical protein